MQRVDDDGAPGKVAITFHPTGIKAQADELAREARTMAAEAMLVVAKNGDPAAERRAERGSGTFAELQGRYLEEHAKKHNKSWKQADALIRRYVLPEFVNDRLCIRA